jgi:hypothetical protein
VGRNLQTFDSGNRAGLKLTPELHAQFVQIVQQTGRISVASGKCGLGVSTARHWMSRGRHEESGPYREFLDDVERARSDFLLLANRRLNQMATGGLIRMPAFDKSGSPIRNHREGCDMEPGCDCELKIVEKVMMPDSRILMWQVDRIDPNPNGETQQPDVPGAPELTEEEKVRQTAARIDLFRAALKIAGELEMPLPPWLDRVQAAIEVGATKVEPEPEPAPLSVDVSDKDPAPAEPDAKPKPPKVRDAF